ncbi:hypothetical protein [Pacificoceanicola onchidii]|uniref:hypothetical protein n=1 Tax=Pacificoceanicola onchidii TaxID=2562685 RepID=UPI0014560C9A|nr:hypothetical protein [Pacificoceanicola onchidii]
MMMTLLTLAILALSTFLALAGLRMVAQDTFHTLSHAADRAKRSGVLIPRVSFLFLWVMIFGLSYMW